MFVLTVALIVMWFRLLANLCCISTRAGIFFLSASKTGDQALKPSDSETPAFGTVVGVVPTHDSAVAETYNMLRRLRGGLIPLVDGDDAGNGKIAELRELENSPAIVLQWRDDWTIEDAVGWILKDADGDVATNLKTRIDREFTSIEELISLFKVKTGAGRLKTDYLAYEEVAAVIGSDACCREHAAALLKALTKVCLGQYDGCTLIEPDADKSNDRCVVLRLTP